VDKALAACNCFDYAKPLAQKGALCKPSELQLIFSFAQSGIKKGEITDGLSAKNFLRTLISSMP
jgi:hypothetical protein